MLGLRGHLAKALAQLLELQSQDAKPLARCGLRVPDEDLHLGLSAIAQRLEDLAGLLLEGAGSDLRLLEGVLNAALQIIQLLRSEHEAPLSQCLANPYNAPRRVVKSRSRVSACIKS